jgi:hypothetical protein
MFAPFVKISFVTWHSKNDCSVCLYPCCLYYEVRIPTTKTGLRCVCASCRRRWGSHWDSHFYVMLCSWVVSRLAVGYVLYVQVGLHTDSRNQVEIVEE